MATITIEKFHKMLEAGDKTPLMEALRAIRMIADPRVIPEHVKPTILIRWGWRMRTPRKYPDPSELPVRKPKK